MHTIRNKRTSVLRAIVHIEKKRKQDSTEIDCTVTEISLPRDVYKCAAKASEQSQSP